MGKRLSFSVAAAALSVSLIAARPAAADPIPVTGGGIFAPWDSSPTSVTLIGTGLTINADGFAGGPGGFPYGTVGNLDGGFDLVYTGIGIDHPDLVTVNGVPYTAFLVGNGILTTQPFLAPNSAPEDSLVTFSTSFTFTGSVRGYPTADRTGATLFDEQLVGSGTARADFVATGDTFLNRSGVNYQFSPASPSPTPEPASLLLLGTGGLVLVACGLRRRFS